MRCITACSSTSHVVPGFIYGKKVVTKKDQRKVLINVVKEIKMFEDHYEMSMTDVTLAY